jgi:hypothetical protein
LMESAGFLLPSDPGLVALSNGWQKPDRAEK